MSEKFVAIVMACVLIGAVVGIAGYKWYEQKQIEEQPAWWTPTEQPTAVATLDITQDTTVFNFSTAIDANGSVSTDTEKTANITIWNNDTRDATNVKISLVNSINGREGLPSALKVNEFEVYIKVSTGYLTKTVYLFKDGQYTDGFDLGTIEKNSNVQIQIGVKVLEADVDTFSDGKSYDMTIYILQGDSAYDMAEFTVLT